MYRRQVLKSIASAAALGAVTIGAGASDAAATTQAGTTRSTPRRPYIESKDGTNLFCRDWGNGKPIVFVHAWALHSQSWQYQMTHLAAHGMRCIAYDRRGHGRSDDPGQGFDLDTLADDLAAVLTHRDLDEVTLVGQSAGTADVVRYLTRHGSRRIARVALLATTLPCLLKSADNPDGVDRKFIDAVRAQWMRDFPKWGADNARPSVMPDTSLETIQWGLRMMEQCSLKAALDYNRAVIEADFRDELKKISVPTLVIHGDADKSAPIALTGKEWPI